MHRSLVEMNAASGDASGRLHVHRACIVLHHVYVRAGKLIIIRAAEGTWLHSDPAHVDCSLLLLMILELMILLRLVLASLLSHLLLSRVDCDQIDQLVRDVVFVGEHDIGLTHGRLPVT